MRHEVGVEVGLGPAHDRVDLYLIVFHLEHGQRRTRRGLESLAAGKPCIERRQRALQRLDLAHEAASVGVLRPKNALGIACGQRGGIGCDRLHAGKAEQVHEFVAVSLGLAEELAGVEEQYRCIRIDGGDEVQQHGAFGAERRHHRRLAGELLGNRAAQHFERRSTFVAFVEQFETAGERSAHFLPPLGAPWRSSVTGVALAATR